MESSIGVNKKQNVDHVEPGTGFDRMQIGNQTPKVMLVHGSHLNCDSNIYHNVGSISKNSLTNTRLSLKDPCFEAISCAARELQQPLITAKLRSTFGEDCNDENSHNDCRDDAVDVAYRLFLEHRPEIVFIDCRYDWSTATRLAKKLRFSKVESSIATTAGTGRHSVSRGVNNHPTTSTATTSNSSSTEFTLIVAVVRTEQLLANSKFVASLLDAGFTRCIDERQCNARLWQAELIQIVHAEIVQQRKLRAASALLHALDSCTDGVVLTDSNHTIQYANHSIETAFGFPLHELIGSRAQDYFQNDFVKTEIDRKLCAAKDGERWSERIYHRRKSGDAMPVWNQIVPLHYQNGAPEFIVYVKEFPFLSIQKLLDRESEVTRHATNNASIAQQQLQQQTSLPSGCPPVSGNVSSTVVTNACPTTTSTTAPPTGRTTRKTSLDVKNGVVEFRRNSMAKFSSSMIDAPITRVIHILLAFKETCPSFIVHTVDMAIDILRNSTAFMPHHQENLKLGDPLTSDLVNGLINTNTSTSRRMSHEAVSGGGSASMNKSASVSSIHAAPPAGVPGDMQTLLDAGLTWSFDVIRLERISNQRPLAWAGYSILTQFDVCNTLKCSDATLRNWLALIEKNYRSNPYHNSTHAADVMQATAYFLDSKTLRTLFNPLDSAISLIAAIIHDVNHPGRNSAFLCNSSHELAILYNDISVLESHHAALAFKLTTGPGTESVNIFRNLPADTYREVRNSIVDMVLATDMAKHFEHLTKFLNVTQSLDRDATSVSGAESESNDETLAETLMPFQTAENILLIKRILIKCADVSNPTRPLETCSEWAKRIAVEYCDQTDEEKRRQLPVVMPAFDRATCSIPKSQIGFIDFFASDLFQAWDNFAGCSELIDNMDSNYEYWKKELAKQEDKVNSIGAITQTSNNGSTN